MAMMHGERLASKGAASDYGEYNATAMPTETPVTRALKALGIPYRLHLHAQPPRSLEQAAAERGLQPAQIVRSLLFRLPAGFVLVLAPGGCRVDWRALRHTLGVRRITTASAQEVEAVTGFPPGAVSPFGLRRPLPILAERSILEHEIVSVGAGIPHAGVILRRADLVQALAPQWATFCQPARGQGR